MKHSICSLFALCSIISVSCLNPEDTQKKHSCLLQVQKQSNSPSIQQSGGELAAPREHKRSKFNPAMGEFAQLNATIDKHEICDDDFYEPSQLEQDFSAHAVEWTTDEKELCDHLPNRDIWIQENLDGDVKSGDTIWSKLCKKGHPPERIEPLAGILRDPRMICDGIGVAGGHFFGIDWLILADHGKMKKSAKRILFDAGGTRFMDAMAYFTGHYGLRGIDLDEIYVWEAERQGTDAYWEEVPDFAKEDWKPKLTFNDGIPVSADPDSDNNPVKRILEMCRPEDFCSFKLDIDTPEVELPIIDQLLAEPRIGEVLDEFFFEHHVAGLMQGFGWGDAVNGTYADSYSIFSRLRQMGVRAHSWI